MIIIEGQECFSCREAAAMLGVSPQTIWRYVTIRKRPERQIHGHLQGGKYYIPKSEIIRFRDEIRPTFGGGPGRPKGSKNKKHCEREPFNLKERKAARMTKGQRLDYLLGLANEMMDDY